VFVYSFRAHIVKWNKICKKKYLSCVPGVDGKIHSSGFVQQGGDSASLVNAYAALRPRDGFSHPHQKHMKDTYSLIIASCWVVWLQLLQRQLLNVSMNCYCIFIELGRKRFLHVCYLCTIKEPTYLKYGWVFSI